jgi:hypothetical protein
MSAYEENIEALKKMFEDLIKENAELRHRLKVAEAKNFQAELLQKVQEKLMNNVPVNLG